MKDLHLHASGAASPRVLYTLVRESGLKTKAKTYWEFLELVTMDRNKVENLDQYLSVLHDIDLVQSSPRALELCFYETFVDSYLSGCEYLELRYNPVKRSLNNSLDLDSLIMAARSGKERACNYFGIDGTIALCMGRDISPEGNAAIMRKALQYKGKGVSTIDVAGSESLPLQPQFEDFYKEARSAGLQTTIHCGETRHERVEEELEYVLRKLKPDRIGHGIRLVDYPDLMRVASLSGVLLEICITSNLMSKAVSDLAEYREIFRRLEDNNIRYTLCTDATHAINTNIGREHELFRQIKSLN